MLYRKRVADRDLNIDCDFVALDFSKYGAWSKSLEHIRRQHPGDFLRVRQLIKDRITDEATGETIRERRGKFRVLKAATVF
jgi:hypothetical protein